MGPPGCGRGGNARALVHADIVIISGCWLYKWRRRTRGSGIRLTSLQVARRRGGSETRLFEHVVIGM